MASTIGPYLDQQNDNVNIDSDLTTSPEEALRSEDLIHTTNNLIIYTTLPIVIIGTIGNILTFAVLIKKNMRTRSIYFYLLLLSCADLSVLYVSALKNWVRFTFNWELIHESDFICKFFWFYLGVSLHMSAWLVVLVTFDRFVAVAFPLKAAIYCTTKRAAITSFVCFLIVVAYHAHLLGNVELQTFNVTNGTTTTMCGPLSENAFMGKPFNYMKLVTYTVTPFISVVILNIGIIYKLRATRFTTNAAPSPGMRVNGCGTRMVRTVTPDNAREVRRVTMLLLVVSFSWLFLSLPFTVISMVNMTGASRYSRAVYYLMKVICFFLLWINHSINFFLYCLSGKKFRNEIYLQLCGRFIRKERNPFTRDVTTLRKFRSSCNSQRQSPTETQIPMISM